MKNELAAIREDINAALEAVAKKHGLKTLTAGKCTYGESNFTFSVTGVKEGGLTTEQQFYKNVEGIFSLPPLGTALILNRRQFITDGINTTGSKVYMKETATGKTYLFETEAVAKRWKEHPWHSKSHDNHHINAHLKNTPEVWSQLLRNMIAPAAYPVIPSVMEKKPRRTRA